MGVPVLSFEQFEKAVGSSKKKWTLIITAKGTSDSRAVDFVYRNFHELDRISGDIVDFYLPGTIVLSEDTEIDDTYLRSEIEVQKQKYPDYHYNRKTEFADSNQYELCRYINSPRLGKIIFKIAEYTDFIFELKKRIKQYEYYGNCQMILVPLIDGMTDYNNVGIYDLDAIANSQSKVSLDFFIHTSFMIIKENSEFQERLLKKEFKDNRFFLSSPLSSLFNPSGSIFYKIKRVKEQYFGTQLTVRNKINKLYQDAVSQDLVNNNYKIIVQNLVIDLENFLHWSLQENYYFISYSSRNVLKAEMLRNEIQKKGLHVWIAPDGIPQGRSYSIVVPTVLKMAKHFVLLLTPDSARSNWVKRELDIAISNEANTKVKVLLAEGFSIDDIQRDNELMFYLNRVQVKFEYDDVVRNNDSLDRFISE